jgi:2-dehydro-3-deoxyphosphogluconate aldolase/(4S)-4-hydroxy-2-oxoglutarate aldolase
MKLDIKRNLCINKNCSKYSRIEVAIVMKNIGIVPVFYHPNLEVCLNVVKACYEGGARVFEFTNRGDFAHDIFAALNKVILNEIPDMILGAGSIVDSATTALYIQNGANFIVSPLINEEMAYICNRRKILWSPGCGSVSEISRAEELGAEIVKIFPAREIGGPSFVENIRGPMPWSNIMPTGGVEPVYENLMEWFRAGVWCVGMGSKLFPKEAIEIKNYETIRENVNKAITLVAKVREDLKLKKK